MFGKGLNSSLFVFEEKYGPLGLVHVDAHTDCNDTMLGEKIAHGTPMRRALEEGCIVGNKVIQIGLRGSNYDIKDYDWGRKQVTFIFVCLFFCIRVLCHFNSLDHNNIMAVSNASMCSVATPVLTQLFLAAVPTIFSFSHKVFYTFKDSDHHFTFKTLAALQMLSFWTCLTFCLLL